MIFYLKKFLVIAIAAAVAYLLHNWLIEHPAISLIKIYSFLGIVTFIIVSILKVIHHFLPDQVGYGFMGLIFIKCSLAIAVFPELILKSPPLSIGDLLGFLSPYLLFLFIELRIVVKLLNNN